MKKYGKPILVTILCLGVLTVFIHLLWVLLYSKSIAYTTEIIKLPSQMNTLEDYQVAFITDTHDATGEELETVVEELNKRDIDVLLLGGDFGWNALVWEQFQVLSKVQTTHGIYAVGGNHDVEQNVLAACEKYGITLLSNKGVSLKNGLFIGGVDDLWVGLPQVSKAVAEAQPEEFVLLLSHNPDVSMEQPLDQVDYMISGHTHGGHATAFGFWAPGLSFVTNYGYRFQKGLSAGQDETPVYTSRGTGWYNRVPRVFSRPEVVLFQLQSEQTKNPL